MADDPGLGPMLEPPAPPGWRIVGVVGPAVAKFDDQGNAGALGKKVADEQGSERRGGGEDRIRRSEERRVGKECVRTGRARWRRYQKKKKKTISINNTCISTKIKQ